MGSLLGLRSFNVLLLYCFTLTMNKWHPNHPKFENLNRNILMPGYLNLILHCGLCKCITLLHFLISQFHKLLGFSAEHWLSWTCCYITYQKGFSPECWGRRVTGLRTKGYSILDPEGGKLEKNKNMAGGSIPKNVQGVRTKKYSGTCRWKDKMLQQRSREK